MHRKHFFILLTISLIFCSKSFSQKQILYKQIDTTKLFMEVIPAVHVDKEKKQPAIVFFFGGGWNEGSIEQFRPHANYFSQRGLSCFLVDYRVHKRQQTTPFESVKDAKSAIRYIREHAEDFSIDPSKIVSSGGSAGGHLAAAAALIDDYNETTDNLSISCIPNALVLFNPVIDNGPAGYGYEQVGTAYKNFSPLFNIKKGAPPTIILIGTHDILIPVETVAYYKAAMEKVESRCELRLYEGQKHGFFNHWNFEIYKDTVSEVDKFLQSLGYVSNEPEIKIE